MKLSVLLLVVLILPQLVFGKLHKDSYICSNGWKITKGDTIQLGKGSHSSGHFWYVRKYTRPHLSMGPEHNNAKVVVEKIYDPPANTNKLVKIYFNIDSVEYGMEVEKALAHSELIAPETYWNYKKNGGHAAAYEILGSLEVNATSEIVFNKLEKWFRAYFTNNTGVIIKIDAPNGIFHAHIKYLYHSAIDLGNSITNGYVECNFEVSYKDGKYQYKFSDFRHFAFQDNHPDMYNFSLLTIDEDCPADKVYTYKGTKWSNKVWNELKYTADTFSVNTMNRFRATL